MVGSIVYATGAYASVALLRVVATATGEFIFTFSSVLLAPVAGDFLYVGWEVIALNNVYDVVGSIDSAPVATSSVEPYFGTGSPKTNVVQLGFVEAPRTLVGGQPIGAVDYAVVRLNGWQATDFSTPEFVVPPTAITAITPSGNTTALATNPPTGVPGTAGPTGSGNRYYAFGTTSLMAGWNVGNNLVPPLTPGTPVRFSISQLSPPDRFTISENMALEYPTTYTPPGVPIPALTGQACRLFNDDAEFFSQINTGIGRMAIVDVDTAPNSGDLLVTYRMLDGWLPVSLDRVVPMLATQLIGGARITLIPVNNTQTGVVPPVVVYDWGYNFTGLLATDFWTTGSIYGKRTVQIPYNRHFVAGSQWIARVEVTSAPRRACIKVPDATTSFFDEQEALARANWRSGAIYPFYVLNSLPLVVNPLGTLTITHDETIIQAGTSRLILSCPAGNGAPTTSDPTKTYRFIIYDASGNQYGAPILATWTASVLSATLVWVTPANYTAFSIVATYGTQGNIRAWATSAPELIPPLVVEFPDLIDDYVLSNPAENYIAKKNFLTIADVQPDDGVLPPPNGTTLVYNVRITGISPTPIPAVLLPVVSSGAQVATSAIFDVTPGTTYSLELLVGTSSNPTLYKTIPFDNQFVATALVLADNTTFVLTNTIPGVASLVVPMAGQVGGTLATPNIASNNYTWLLQEFLGGVYEPFASGSFTYTPSPVAQLSTGDVTGLNVGSTYAFSLQHGSPLQTATFYQSIQGTNFTATNGVNTFPISSTAISVSSATNILQVVYDLTNSPSPPNPPPALFPPALVQYQVYWQSTAGAFPFPANSQVMFPSGGTNIQFPWLNTNPGFLAYVWYRGQFRLMVDGVQTQLSSLYNCATCQGISAITPTYTTPVPPASVWTFNVGVDQPAQGTNVNPGENEWQYRLVYTLGGFQIKGAPTTIAGGGRNLTWNIVNIDPGTNVYVELRAVQGLDVWIFSSSPSVLYP